MKKIKFKELCLGHKYDVLKQLKNKPNETPTGYDDFGDEKFYVELDPEDLYYFKPTVKCDYILDQLIKDAEVLLPFMQVVDSSILTNVQGHYDYGLKVYAWG